MSIFLDTGPEGRIELALVQRSLLLDKKPSILRWHMAYWVFSAIDLFLTIASFRIGGLEMNPIANWFYMQFGISALVVYKVMMVILITMQIGYIGKYKPLWAKRIYTFGIATLVLASTLSLCQTIWFIYEYGWSTFKSAIQFAL